MGKQETLMLIDGHALAYRAYHALPPLASPAGEPTNATLGFANMLLKAIEDYAPDYVVATFDPARTFRHEEYAEYKATRAKTPDDLRAQFGRIRELTETLGIPVHVVDGYEADDVLGTLSLEASRQGLRTIIVTGDSDTFQLIDEYVSILTPRRSFGQVELYTPERIQERYGLEPSQLIDLKSLTGDSSDNIPGVRGVGKKTAARLMADYGSLEAIYEHLDEVTPTRFRNALEKGREEAKLSQHLITIVRDVDVKLALDHARWGEFDRSAVMSLLRELGFRNLANRIPGGASAPMDGEQLGLFGAAGGQAAASTRELSGDYTVIDSVSELEKLVAQLHAADVIAIDTETTGTDAMRADLVGISLSAESGTGYYVAIGHDPAIAGCEQVSLEDARRLLSPVFQDVSKTLVMHNAKYDMTVLDQHQMPVAASVEDTMIAAWLLSASGRGIGLKDQAWQRLGVEMTPIKELIGTGRKQVTMDRVPVSRAAPYACADADMTLRLRGVLRPELEEKELIGLYDEMEMPLLPVLLDMEETGMLVDRAYLDAMSDELTSRLGELQDQIYGMAGHPFNIKSTKQLGVVLFEEMGLPVIRRTKTGYSTDAAVLDALEKEHPIAALLAEHRQLEKLKGTYVDALPELIHPRTGRVHTSFSQTAASTGRLSSSDPNLQNIPVRSELGRRVRGAFVAAEGCVLLGCDYSQVELRLLAHVSQDPELLGAFHRDEDVHASTAAAVFDVPLAEVSYAQRSLAKAINFGLMYGMSGYGLSARTDLSVPEAEAFIATYFGRFAKVREYLDNTKAYARDHGYVETLLGRRRYFPELLASNAARHQVKRSAERAAVNMPIQGSAADIIKLAMIRLYDRLEEQGYKAKMVLQVHDELVLETPEDELDAVTRLVVDTMENAYKLDVRLKVDVATAKNWMEMK